MNRAQAYIFRQVGVSMLFIVVTLTAVIWLTQAMRFIRLILNKGLSIDLFFYITALLLPGFLLVTMPLSLFFAALFTLNKMMNDRELIVLRATGMSHSAIAAPVLALGLITAGIGYGISLYLLPVTYQEFRRIQFDVRNNFSTGLLLEGTFNSVGNGLTMYVRAREENGIEGILVQDSRKPEAPVTIMAKRGVVVAGPEGPRVVLYEGNRQELDRKAGKVSILYFTQYTIDVSTLAVERETYREPTGRFLHELFNPGDSADDRANRYKLMAEGHNRLIVPFFALTLPLLALAFILGGEFNKRGQLPRLVAACVAVAAVQGMAIGFLNAAGKSPAVVPLMYATAVVPAFLALWSVFGGRRAPRPFQPVLAAAEAR
jgi:lipopolysaccharide export system permease protein